MAVCDRFRRMLERGKWLRLLDGRRRFTFDDMETSAETTGQLDEHALLSALQQGDDAAYATLVERYSPRMLAVARRFLSREEDACDVLQDAFLSAFKGLASFDGRAQLGTWLHRIVVNAALMRLRSQKRRPETAIEELLPRYEADGHRHAPGPAWTITADRAAELLEQRELVRRCIDQLPESYRTVLLLRDLEAWDTAEVAHRLGVTEGVVKTRLHRARQALRELLDPYFRGDSP